MLAFALALTLAGSAWSGLPISFAAVELGTPLSVWWNLKPPGLVSDHVRPACSDDPGAASSDLRLSDVPADAVVCGYVDVYGHLRLPVTFPWRHGYQMDHLHYVFRQGRLTEIRASLENGAYNAITAEMTSNWGPPSQLIRDTTITELGRLPRVQVSWTPPGGRISIIDPSSSGKLELRLSLAATKPGLSQKPPA